MNNQLKITVVAILIAAFGIMVPATALAEFSHEDCKFIEETAEIVMEKRQEGIRSSRLVDIIRESEEDEGVIKAYEELIYEAYNEPQYSSPEYRQDAVNSFADGYYRSCMNN